MNPAIVVDFVANTKDLKDGFKDAGGAASGFGSKLKGAALGVATAGFAALAATVKIGADEFASAQKVAAQTDSVLKSTGGAAKVTADHVSTLAGELMKKSGVDDEAIQSGENLLLTFTNIRNEAGKGNDVFDQTTKAALDMSVAMGTDMKTASMTLGKALNDPLKGMNKLTKQGVTFTDAQKEQAAAMVKAGDTAGAQKIILAELTKEFGGSAEAAGKTLPGQISILKESFSNLAGELVGKLIPPLTALGKLISEHKTLFTALGVVVAALVVGCMAYSAIVAVIEVATGAWTAAQWLLNAAMSANPIGIVIIVIAALVAAFVIAYKKSDKFREIVDKTFSVILGAATALWNWIKSNWPLLLAILTGPIGAAVLIIKTHWDTIKDAVQDAVGLVKGWITGAWNAIKSTTSTVWNAVSGAITEVIHDIKTALNALASWVTTFASGVLSTAVNKVKDIWDNVREGAESAIHAVKTAFNGMIEWLGGIVSKISEVIGRVANAIKAPINKILSAWNSISLTIPKIDIPSIKIGKKKIGGGSFGGQTIGFPNVPLLAQGGVVNVPTLAMVGEGQGREIVTPERLLREIVAEGAGRSVEVRVFIGDTELKSMVRTEVGAVNTGIARTLLAGAA